MTEVSDEERPVKCFDLAPSDFPFTIECRDPETGELFWSETVDGPGALAIRGMNRDTHIRVTYADGTVMEAGNLR